MESTESVKEYLCSLENFPTKAKLIDVKPLTGGLCNYVYSLSFDDNTFSVLKYFPDYAACNKNVKMSQKRYFIEKEAMRLLSNDPYLINNTRIRVPKLIYYDDQAYTLVMEHIGEKNFSLLDYLKLSDNKSTKNDEIIDMVAEEIYKFSDFLSNKTKIRSKTHQDPFSNEPIWDYLNNAGNLYKSQAKLYNLEKEIEPFISLGNQLELERKKHPENDVFVYGDLWPNSILIDQDKKLIWIIDWEMSRFESTLTDLNQLMSNLWIMKQNPVEFDSDSINKIMRRLQFEFFKDENIDWRVKCGKSSFILMTISLIKELHWKIDDPRTAMLNALNEIEKIA